MKTKWFTGLGLVIAVLLGIGVFAAVLPSEAQAYGPGGNRAGQGTQTGSGMGLRDGSGQGMQNGAGMGLRDGSGQGMQNGAGMGPRQGQGGPANGSGQCCTTASVPLSEQSLKALDEAIQEEYLARDTYQAIVNKFGSVLPFSNIVRSEQQHINALARQYTNQGLAVPTDSWAGKVQAPATVSEAFSAAIQLEKDDAALYDTLLKSVTEPTLTKVFTQLQSASLNMHLKSLEYYNK